MDQIGGDKFFFLVEKHSHFHHDIAKSTKKNQKQMKELLVNPQERLEVAVKIAIGKEVIFQLTH